MTYSPRTTDTSSRHRKPWPLMRRFGEFATLAQRRFCCALALFALFGSCHSEELVLAVARATMSLPFYIADSQGYFAAEGVNVRTQECTAGQHCLKLLFEGKAQLATAADIPVVFNSFERNDYAILATFVSSSRDVKLVTRKSAGITQAKQLEGKRVAVVKGTSAHYFLDSSLILNDVDVKKVTVVSLQPDQMVAALERQEVDAVAIWEPFAYLAMKALGADGTIFPSPRIYTETFNLIAQRHTIAAREGDLVKVLRALERSQQFIRERPKQAQDILLEKLKLDQGFVEWGWSDFDYRMSLDQSLVTTLEGEARWATREGHVAAGSRIANFLDLVHSAPLRQTVPGAVTLVK